MIRGEQILLSLLCWCLTTIMVVTTATSADRTLVDIIVAQNVKSELQPKLDRLATDLRNDGYTARITSWPAGKSPENVWNHLKDGYDNHNLQGALLVGHIPMHRRDTSTVEVRNTATDAVYWCMSSYESMEPLHIWVSRFYAPSSSSYGSEVALLTNALDANHDYRTGASRLSHKAWTSQEEGMLSSSTPETWAGNILDTWPESEAATISRLPSVLFQYGGDFLFEHSHGFNSIYAKRYITTNKVFSNGCTIRVFFGQSCLAGALGGVINTQNITSGTKNILSFGLALPSSAWGGYTPVVEDSDSDMRNLIANGVSWGKAIIAYKPSQYPFIGKKSVVYGDLSLPSMMFPPTGLGPGRAGDPSPEHKELYVQPEGTVLRWASRVGTTSHDVYFGTDATPDDTEFQGNRNTTSFDLPDLTQGTTYYWRVDEVNAYGKTIGNVWSFTTEKDTIPRKAEKPVPGHEDASVCIDMHLRWSAGTEATSFDVYFEADDSSPDVLVAEGIRDTTFDPGILDHNRPYFWRVDAKNGFGTTATGDVWSFTTEKAGPKRLYENLDTVGSVEKTYLHGVLFTIAQPIRITGISVDNLLVGSRKNVGIWREGKTTSPLHTFSVETGPTKRVVTQTVDIELSKGTYRMAGLFKEYHISWISHLDVACGVTNLKGVYESSTTRLQFPSIVSNTRVKGHVNFTFETERDDIVETVVSPQSRMVSPDIVSAQGSILIRNGIPGNATLVVRMTDVRGRTLWSETIEPTGKSRKLIPTRIIPLPSRSQGTSIVTVSDGVTILRKKIVVLR